MQKNIFNINILSFNRKKIIKKEYLYISMHIYIFYFKLFHSFANSTKVSFAYYYIIFFYINY